MDVNSVNLECAVGVYPRRTAELTAPLVSVHIASVSSSLGMASRQSAECNEFCYQGLRNPPIGHSNCRHR